MAAEKKPPSTLSPSMQLYTIFSDRERLLIIIAVVIVIVISVINIKVLLHVITEQ